MRFKVILIVILALIWAGGSWRWYTCSIKGFCGASFVQVSPEAIQTPNAIELASVDAPIPVTEIDLDSDHDGVTDKDERRWGTDPSNIDSDGDGFSDSRELGKIYSTARDTDLDGVIDALDQDDDNDSLLTINEALLATSAYSADSDNDGLADNYEVGSNISDPVDTDNDGIINAVDYDDDNDGIATRDEHADPNSDGNPIDAKDTDNDGVVDYLDANEDPDRDNDGLSNAIEMRIGSNPDNSDSDGDGISDAEEVGIDYNHPNDIDNNGIIDILEAYVFNLPEMVEYIAPKQMEIVIEQDQRARVHFPFNDSTSPILSAETEIYFTNLVTQLKAGKRVKLIGHTDDIGYAASNLKLALARAEMIQQLLIERGAPAANITVESKGETEPLQSNDTELGRGTNRRVELVTIK